MRGVDRPVVIERCDGSGECRAAEHIEGCFATTKRHAQRSWAPRYGVDRDELVHRIACALSYYCDGDVGEAEDWRGAAEAVAVVVIEGGD